MRMQLRRAAVSVASNIVEGSARRTTREYCHFINIALGSASELGYLTALATELGFIRDDTGPSLANWCRAVTKHLQRLEDELQLLIATERGN